MPRYEFSEGPSNKFWEIRRTGRSLTTRYGRIGAAGQSTTHDHASQAEATAEHDRLVAEKLKKGYALVGAGTAKVGLRRRRHPASPPLNARNRGTSARSRRPRATLAASGPP